MRCAALATPASTAPHPGGRLARRVNQGGSAAGLQVCARDVARRPMAHQWGAPAVLTAALATTTQSLVRALVWLVPQATIKPLLALTRAHLVLPELTHKQLGLNCVWRAQQGSTHQDQGQQAAFRVCRACTA